VLSASHRLTSAADFKQAVRRGRRCGGPVVVVHLVDSNVDKATSRSGGHQPARVGFVVARSVGPAVIRNRVKRRLRHVMRARVDALPADSLVVVRALPAAADASYRDLEAEVDRCLQRVSSS